MLAILPMSDLKLFGDDVLNIFCDASILKLEEETIGCPGSIAISPSGNIVDAQVRLLRYSTNNNSEITAILMAVQQAIVFRYNFRTINIFSDSKISVFGLKTWIYNWFYSMTGGVLYSSSGEPVANQQIFLHIIHLIVHSGLSVNIYHQKGHVTSKNLLPAKQVFLESNGMFLTDDEASYISKYNDHIDVLTKKELINLHGNISEPKYESPIIYGIDKPKFKQYMDLIGGK